MASRWLVWIDDEKINYLLQVHENVNIIICDIYLYDYKILTKDMKQEVDKFFILIDRTFNLIQQSEMINSNSEVVI